MLIIAASAMETKVAYRKFTVELVLAIGLGIVRTFLLSMRTVTAIFAASIRCCGITYVMVRTFPEMDAITFFSKNGDGMILNLPGDG